MGKVKYRTIQKKQFSESEEPIIKQQLIRNPVTSPYMRIRLQHSEDRVTILWQNRLKTSNRPQRERTKFEGYGFGVGKMDA